LDITSDASYSGIKELGIKPVFFVWVESIFTFNQTNAAATYNNQFIQINAIGPGMLPAGNPYTASFGSIQNWKNVYGKYRVLKCKLEWMLANRQTANGVLFSVVPSRKSFAANGSSWPTFRINPEAKHYHAVNAGYYKFVWQDKMMVDFMKFLGDGEGKFDDTYSAATNPTGDPAVPPNGFYLNIGATIIGSGTFSNPGGEDGYIRSLQLVELSEPNFQAS
jgi:hypothetical protein